MTFPTAAVNRLTGITDADFTSTVYRESFVQIANDLGEVMSYVLTASSNASDIENLLTTATANAALISADVADAETAKNAAESAQSSVEALAVRLTAASVDFLYHNGAAQWQRV